MIKLRLETPSMGMNTSSIQIGESNANLSNLNNPDFCRHTVHLETMVASRTGLAQGVEVAAIRRETDQFLTRDVQQRTYVTEKVKTILSYQERLEPLFGSFGDASVHTNTISQFFLKWDRVVANPQNIGDARQVLDAGRNLAKQLNQIANGVQKLRSNADKEIGQSVNAVNMLLKEYRDLNESIGKVTGRGGHPIDLESKRDAVALKLAQFLPIQELEQQHGKKFLILTSGEPLVQDKKISTLAFQASPLVRPEMSIGDPQFPLSGLTMNGMDITPSITEGKIAGLFQTRDVDLPNVQEQLDRLAVSLRDEINKLHNQGTSFQAPQRLTGSQIFDQENGTPFQGAGHLRVLEVNNRTKLCVLACDIDLATLGTVFGGPRNPLEDLIGRINRSGGCLRAGWSADHRLEIWTQGNPDHGLAITSIDGQPLPTERGSGLDFAHFFGLNDFFVGGKTLGLPLNPVPTITGVANIIAVNPQLLAHPEYLAVATSNRNPDPLNPQPQEAVTQGDATNAMRIAEAFEEIFQFDPAGSIPHLDSTFAGYSATIVQFTADQAAKATDHFRSSSQLLQSTEKDLKAISGVNFEEEVQSLNLFRQHNESCAYAFSMTKQAEDKILDIFRA